MQQSGCRISTDLVSVQEDFLGALQVEQIKWPSPHGYGEPAYLSGPNATSILCVKQSLDRCGIVARISHGHNADGVMTRYARTEHEVKIGEVTLRQRDGGPYS